MRWGTHILSVVLSLSSLSRGDPTWPSQIDELEEIMYQVQGYRARQFGGTVIPCSSEASGPGRHNAAEWLRAAFHDMATTTIAGGPRQGGLDGSLQYELTSSDNLGPGFNTTLKFMADYYTSRSSVADLIALGVYYAVRSCGGPVVPIAAGRVDATSGGPIGVPLPQNSAFTFEQQFARMGFSQTEMIQSVACGHSIGGVHELEFPEIVPVGSTQNGEAPMDSTVATFDNKVVTEYIAGNTTNPMVVGPSVKATRNSDFKVFNSDGNVTVNAMAAPQTFNSVCATVLRKLIEVVPDGVVLTDPIQPYAVKPVDMQLTLNSGASTMQLSGLIRVRSTDFGSDSATSVTLTYKDRSGGSNCGVRGCTYTASLLGATQGFDDTFVWFPINTAISTSSGISSYTLTLTMASGTSKVYDNNGNSYPLQDGILMQKPQSCLLQGNLNVVAAVRNDLNSLPVNMYLSYKTPVGDPNRPVPTLSNTTVAMTKGDCVGAYTFYTAAFTGLGDLDYATKIDVISGSGATAQRDDFNAASELAATCVAFNNPPSSLCTTAPASTPPASTSSSVGTVTSPTVTSPTVTSPTVTSPTVTASTTSSGTVSSTGPAETLHHRQTLGDYRLVGCKTESTVPGTRALNGAAFVYDGMTLESCMKNCTGYYYWGAEYGRECYCGNSLDPSSNDAAIAECNMVCSGDPTEYCGAGNRVELYVTTGTIPTPVTPTHKPTVSTYAYEGCWTEGSGGVRALGAKATAGNVTLESCAEFCQDYHYFGTEYGRECYCGNVPDASSNQTDLADCNMPCSGDISEYCGASNRLDLYYSNTTNGPSQPVTVGNYSWYGCQTEATSVRALSAKSLVNDNMTLEACATFCEGYMYFGAEYGAECYCGNMFGAGSEDAPASDCNMACKGNTKELCGAGNRLSAYELAPSPLIRE
ncbi:heme peroxidase [Xylariaceae sp. FL1651]|nr:heme peroxidase [Xylariaceae sp. FL1651]